MADDHLLKKGDPGGIPKLPWGKIAFWGGVCMALVVAVVGLFLIRMEDRLQQRMARLTREMAWAEDITNIIVDLGKPGNDLLENYDIEKEQHNLRRYREAFAAQWPGFRQTISRHQALEEDLGRLEALLSRLKTETDAVFSALVAREANIREARGAAASDFERQAAAAMARMDRQYGLSLKTVMRMRRYFLSEQSEVSDSMQSSFYTICFLTLIEFFSFAIGLYLLMRLGKEHERALVLQKYIANVVSNIPSGIVVLSDERLVLSANRSFRKMFWKSQDMLKGKRLGEVFPMLDLNGRAKEVLLTKKASKDILLNISSGGKQREKEEISGRYFHLSLVPLEGEHVPNQGRLLLVARDVTSMKKAELQTRLILTNTQDGVVIFGEKGEIQWVNPAAERMFGRKKAKLLKEPFSSLMPESQGLLHCKIIDGFIHANTPKAFGKRYLNEGLRSNGSPFPMEIVISGFKAEGRWTFTAFLRDKTEEVMAEAELEALYAENKAAYEKLKAKQQQLVQSEKMASIGQLAAGVAHEINNPVGFVKSNLGRMKEYSAALSKLLERYGGFLNGIEQKEKEAIAAEAAQIVAMAEEMQSDFIVEDLPVLLDESIDGIDRVREIVKNLKEFSHVDRGGKRPFNLNDGLESTLKIAWNELKYDSEVLKEYGEIPDVFCRPQQINQVFMNLLVNAAHAIKEKAKASAESSDKAYRAEKGKIVIRTYSEAGFVVAEIEDSGTGIPEDKIEKIFDPFFTTKPVGKGTGLGLSISYGIIKKHGGQIEVQSEVGVGTRFKVLLPEEAPAAAPGVEGPPALSEQEA